MYSIISYSVCQDALAFTKGRTAQICSEEGLIMSLLLLWSLIDELVLRDPAKQPFPGCWNRSSVRRANSGETSINTRQGRPASFCLCAFKESAIVNLIYRNLPLFLWICTPSSLKIFFDTISDSLKSCKNNPKSFQIVFTHMLAFALSSLLFVCVMTFLCKG